MEYIILLGERMVGARYVNRIKVMLIVHIISVKSAIPFTEWEKKNLKCQNFWLNKKLIE